ASQPSKPAPTQWRCRECGYIHDGTEPPDECPICGAPKESFEAVEAAPVQTAGNEHVKIVIVGAGIAGISAAESARKAAPQAEITLLSSEEEFPYYRLNLTRYLAGELGQEQLALHPESWYSENNIHLLRNTTLQSIDLASKKVSLSDGSLLEFDRLILTVGSRPFIPPFPGADRKNVSALRTLKDAEFILENSKAGKKCVCIGGGLLGLETAGALAQRGADVTVVENQPWLLPRQLNQAAGKIFQKLVEAKGISLRIGVKTVELIGDTTVQGVLLEDGTTLTADIVIISAGVRPNLDLARQAGLQVNLGILVDADMRTSHSDVFAAGDAAEFQKILYGIWGPSQGQGVIAGMNAAGQAAQFVNIPRSNTLKVLGINLYSIGKTNADAANQTLDLEQDGRYFGFIFEGSLMVGAILLGDTSLSTKIKKIIEDRLDCASILKPGVNIQELVEKINTLA
ncbi:MAG: FAD-dependent oxidoreductase, partial [Anaerolineaceae bacterium]|nr:FAD-dependent oxidoreductase [Anaerolineaceae bacterium]